jgi:hypothetical protein
MTESQLSNTLIFVQKNVRFIHHTMGLLTGSQHCHLNMANVLIKASELLNCEQSKYIKQESPKHFSQQIHLRAHFPKWEKMLY